MGEGEQMREVDVDDFFIGEFPVTFAEYCSYLDWLEEHEYDSVEQLKGSLSQKNCEDPSAFERAQYMRAISSFPLPPAQVM